MTDKVIDYSVSVKDKTVTLTVKSQISDIKKYLDKKSKFGKYDLASECYVGIGSDTIYLIGSVKSDKKDSSTFVTSAEAFSAAAAISDSIDKFAKFVTATKAAEKKAAEKKAAAKKTVKTAKAGSNFEYSVSVDGKAVTFEVLKQTEEVKNFFWSEKCFTSGRIESAAVPQIINLTDRLKVYIKGNREDTKTTHVCSSNSAALTLAAKITALFDEAQKTYPEVFASAPLKLEYVDKFIPDNVYLDTTDGEVLIATSTVSGLSAKIGFVTRSFTSTEKWIHIPGTLSAAVKLFGGLNKPTVLKKFNDLNKTGKKQIWHK